MARYFPKKDIVSWQALTAAMEKGEKPCGSIYIAKDPAHILELQEVAKATETTGKITLVSKFGDEQLQIPGAKEALLPVVSNLALLKCRIACLSQGAPDIKGENAQKISIKEDDGALVVLRVTIPTKYVEKKFHHELYGYPHLALKILEAKEEAKTCR